MLKFISNERYPILDYIDMNSPFAHEKFKEIFKKADADSVIRSMLLTNPSEVLGELERFDFMPEVLHIPNNLTRENLARWPFFSIAKADYDSLSKEQILGYIKIINILWEHLWNLDHQTPEIIREDIWIKACDNGPCGFEEWLEKKQQGENDFNGIVLRPWDEIAVLYNFHYVGEEKEIENDDPSTEIEFAFNGRRLVWTHRNYQGFLSHNIVLHDFIYEIAEERGWTPDETFFEHDTYYLLKYIYFKEYYHLKTRYVNKGETISIGKGVDIRINTDCRCSIIDEKIA